MSDEDLHVIVAGGSTDPGVIRQLIVSGSRSLGPTDLGYLVTPVLVQRLAAGPGVAHLAGGGVVVPPARRRSGAWRRGPRR